MQAELILDRGVLIRRWLELCASANSPAYFELNQFGEMIENPQPSVRERRIAHTVSRELEAQLGPEAAVEISVMTDQGVRVPDVIWMPPSRWARWQEPTPLPFAPDICVEVLTPADSTVGTEMKKGAYLRAGAREIILISPNGAIEFFGTGGKRGKSALGVALFLSRDPG
jgi:Uma2 family endonuclease